VAIWSSGPFEDWNYVTEPATVPCTSILLFRLDLCIPVFLASFSFSGSTGNPSRPLTGSNSFKGGFPLGILNNTVNIFERSAWNQTTLNFYKPPIHCELFVACQGVDYCGYFVTFQLLSSSKTVLATSGSTFGSAGSLIALGTPWKRLNYTFLGYPNSVQYVVVTVGGYGGNASSTYNYGPSFDEVRVYVPGSNPDCSCAPQVFSSLFCAFSLVLTLSCLFLFFWFSVLQGLTGNKCQFDVDECKTTSCQNSGTCVNVFGGFRCFCTPGYGGEVCELNKDECESDPCQVAFRLRSRLLLSCFFLFFLFACCSLFR
jgi:hypothetical protein